MRRVSGRDDLVVVNSGWYAHLWFSHLPLSDYLSGQPTEEAALCPDDEDLFERTEVPIDSIDPRLVFRLFESSYAVVHTTFSPDMVRSGQTTNSGEPYPLTQSATSADTTLRQPRYLLSRRLNEVSFTSSKVWMYDHLDRHDDPRNPRYFADPEAKSTVLMFDGSVGRKATADSNPGFQPDDPTSPSPTIISVSQGPGVPRLEYNGVYRWTRGGLRGIDFGGGEIYTGQPRN